MRSLEGVTAVEASPLEHRLIVHYDPRTTSEASIVLAVDRIVASLPQ